MKPASAIATPTALTSRSGQVVNEVSPSMVMWIRRLDAEVAVAVRARLRHIGQRDRIEADPGVQALHEAVALGQGQQGVDRGAIQQAEVAGVGRHLEAVGAVEQRVEEPRAEALEQRLRRRGWRAPHRPRRRRCASARPWSEISAGGCCRSASIITTTSPAAACRPAVSAASLPKLRDSCSTRKPGSAAQSAITAGVLSVLPSSTRMISQPAVDAGQQLAQLRQQQVQVARPRCGTE